jgi:hypothetical protein
MTSLYVSFYTFLAGRGLEDALMVQLYLFLTMIPIAAALAVIAGKARENPLAILLPVYSEIVLLRIVARPIWWLGLILLPQLLAITVAFTEEPVRPAYLGLALGLTGWVVWIAVLVGLAERFGKGTLAFLGLVFVPFITLPILAFGTYQPPGTRRRATSGRGSRSSGRSSPSGSVRPESVRRP